MNADSANIVVYGAGWIHNIGNAFIQLGSKYAVEQALPGANVHVIEGNYLTMPTSAADKLLLKLSRTTGIAALRQKQMARIHAARSRQRKLSDLASVDAVMLSGVWLSAKYLREHRRDFLELKERGIPLIFSGGGGTFYTEEEFAEVTEQLHEIKPHAIITRDDVVYEAYKNSFERVYAGIDVGFFIGDCLRPLPMPKRTVYCFDRGPMPAVCNVTDDSVVTHHSQGGLRHDTFDQGQLFFGEMAEDYVHLYANAPTVYSDRVHACVAALSFGNSAHLIDETPRAHLFEVVGADSIREGVTTLSVEKTAARKAQHITALKEVFSSL